MISPRAIALDGYLGRVLDIAASGYLAGESAAVVLPGIVPPYIEAIRSGRARVKIIEDPRVIYKRFW